MENNQTFEINDQNKPNKIDVNKMQQNAIKMLQKVKANQNNPQKAEEASRNLDLINKTLKRTGYKNLNELGNINASKTFAETFTAVMCEYMFSKNDILGFAYPWLITREGQTIFGNYIRYQCKASPVAEELDCDNPTSCEFTWNPTDQFEDNIKVRMLRVSDAVDKYCLYQKICSEEGINDYFEAIRNDLVEAINDKVEVHIERDFSNEDKYTKIIEVARDADDKIITKAIQEAYFSLVTRNRFNPRGLKRKTPFDLIRGFINMRAWLAFDIIKACCYNADKRFNIEEKLNLIEFKNKDGSTNKDILLALFDQRAYLLWFGRAEFDETKCPNDPKKRKQFLYNQYAADWNSCHSRVLVKMVDAKSDDQIEVDKQLNAYGEEMTSTLDFATIKKSGTATAQELGITKPSGGEGTTDTYEVVSSSSDSKSIQVKVTITKNDATQTKTITILASDAGVSADQVDVNKQLDAYQSTMTSTLDYENIKKTNGTATAGEIGITKPSAATGTTDVYTITNTNASSKTISVNVKVDKGLASGNKNVTIKARDAVLQKNKKLLKTPKSNCSTGNYNDILDSKVEDVLKEIIEQ